MFEIMLNVCLAVLMYCVWLKVQQVVFPPITKNECDLGMMIACGLMRMDDDEWSFTPYTPTDEDIQWDRDTNRMIFENRNALGFDSMGDALTQLSIMLK